LERLDARPVHGVHRTRSSHVLHRLGAWSAKASTGFGVAIVLVMWGVVGAIGGFPHWWEVALYSTTSAVTVVMLFAIQHTQRREQVIVQTKLDELLRTQPEADDRMIAAEAADDDELRDLVTMGPDDPRTHALRAALDDDDAGTN
jgi:low affinity Fe/Cu permease